MQPASLSPGVAKVVTGLLLAATMLVPLVARAQVSIEVQTCLDSVSNLFEKLDYERALEQIASAKRLTRGVEDDVALSLYEGVILAEMAKKGEASAAFKTALFLQPETKLPMQVAPKVEHLFEELRQQVKQELASVSASQRLEAQQSPAETKPPQEEQDPEASIHVLQSPETGLVPLAVAQLPRVEAKPQQEIPPTGNISWSEHPRTQVLIPAIAGGVLLAVGGVSWGIAKAEQSRLRSGDPRLTSYADVQQSMSRGASFQTVGVGFMGAGLMGLGLAAGFYLLGTPETPTALAAGTDGTSALVYGRWP